MTKAITQNHVPQLCSSLVNVAALCFVASVPCSSSERDARDISIIWIQNHSWIGFFFLAWVLLHIQNFRGYTHCFRSMVAEDERNACHSLHSFLISLKAISSKSHRAHFVWIRRHNLPLYLIVMDIWMCIKNASKWLRTNNLILFDWHLKEKNVSSSLLSV